MLKKFINWIKKYLTPTEEEIHIDEAKRLLLMVTSRFSIEEQADIVEKVKEGLIEHRKQEIIDAEKHLLRLKANLDTMELVVLE